MVGCCYAEYICEAQTQTLLDLYVANETSDSIISDLKRLILAQHNIGMGISIIAKGPFAYYVIRMQQFPQKMICNKLLIILS